MAFECSLMVFFGSAYTFSQTFYRLVGLPKKTPGRAVSVKVYFGVKVWNGTF